MPMNATASRTTRAAWPAVRSGRSDRIGSAKRVRSMTTGVVLGIGRDVAGRGSPAGSRASRAATKVAHDAWSGVRHRRRCFSVVSWAGGKTAVQRC